MSKNIDKIKNKIIKFCEDGASMPDLETKTSNFLFSEIVNDLNEKNIKNFGDWLKYYSTEGNNFDEVVTMSESYYYKVLREDYNSISMEEKIMIYNAIGLYCVEMDIEKPTGKLLGTVISTFIEIVRHYNLFIKGYLSVKGDILISDRTKSKFFTVVSGLTEDQFKIPVTLFK